MSADGAVVVGNNLSGNAYRWTSGGGAVDLGDLPGGSVYSYGNAVSADGNTIVGYGVSASGYEAFRWTSGAGMVGLGDLTGGSFGSEATAVNSDGSVIVGNGTNAAGTEAFR